MFYQLSPILSRWFFFFSSSSSEKRVLIDYGEQTKNYFLASIFPLQL